MNENLFDRLRPIGFTHTQAAAFAAAGIAGTWPARATEVRRESVTVHDGLTAIAARPLPQLARQLAERGETLAVGDWIAVARDRYAEPWMHALLPSTSRIVRIDANGCRHTLVSNVDTALIVMGLDGDFNPRRVERYLALAQAAGVWPVIVLTKRDCVARPEESIDALRRRIPPAVPIEAVNATAVEAAATLAPYLVPGRTVVLLGSSGAGKSTLTNILLGQHVQPTGEVRAADSRGRHTTTSRSLHCLAGGACVIDTPGLRGLRVELDHATLAASFSDIAELSQQCRFRDCRHIDEPGCQVLAAVAADRLKNFHKLAREVQREQMTFLDRRRQLAQWRSRGRAAAERMKMKRG